MARTPVPILWKASEVQNLFPRRCIQFGSPDVVLLIPLQFEKLQSPKHVFFLLLVQNRTTISRLSTLYHARQRFHMVPG